MKFYETLYILNPNLEDDVVAKTMNEIVSELSKTKSKVINHYIWGKKRLAYPIDKQKYGSYILMQYEGGDGDSMVDFDTWMKLNNTVLRHMTVGLNSKPEIYVEPIKEASQDKENVENTEDASEDVVDEGATEDVVDEGATEDVVDEGTIEEVVDEGATEEVVDEDATEEVVDEDATDENNKDKETE